MCMCMCMCMYVCTYLCMDIYIYVYIHVYVCFLGYALHETGLQRQVEVGTLVSSQRRRALAVLVINCLSSRVKRGSTAGQIVFSFLHRYKYDCVCS